MRHNIAAAIDGYQRFVSPWKGFCCAHNVLHRRGSCSVFGKRLVLRSGVWRFVLLMRLRFLACGKAHRILASVPIPEAGEESSEEPGAGEKAALWCLADVATNAACCLIPLF